jgi:hypothetical protein
MLTAIPPKRHRVGNTNHDDLYIRPGEPIGYRNMCPASIEMLLSGFTHLDYLDTTEVEINAKVCNEDENSRQPAYHQAQCQDGQK